MAPDFICDFGRKIIRSGSGRYPVDPVRMRAIDGRSEGVLMGVEAICFHNWLVSVSGGVRARRCVLLVSIGSKPTLGGDPGAWWQMAKGQRPRKLCLLAQASGCEGRQAGYTAARRTSDTLRTTLWIASSIVKCIFNSFPSFFSPRSVASRCCFGLFASLGRRDGRAEKCGTTEYAEGSLGFAQIGKYALHDCGIASKVDREENSTFTNS